MNYKLAFLGFGNVGKALALLLLKKEAELKHRYDLSFTVTGIATGSHGSAINLQGIDLEQALKISDYAVLSTHPAPASAMEFIQQCGADVLFENTPVNYETGQPAIDHLKLALELGMHAITANKGPVVHAYQTLTSLAKSKHRKFFFESTVMDGAPIFSLYRETIPCANLLSIQGVLNSTTNMMLTRMELGDSFDDAVAYCQKIGIAETDPSGDIDGWDASVKVAALVTVMMGVPLKPHEVDRQGIRDITPEMVAQAKSQGQRYKLVCSARRVDGGVQAKVAPQLVGIDSPMFGVEGTTSIVQFETDVLGLLSVVEADPGPHTTAYGLFADFLNAVGN
ncbi:MAG TPA: homoserine dehydrogenase [Anaerolineales bacterium]|nr:homoserine dehydrogenase [Anaerolineales bacterium]